MHATKRHLALRGLLAAAAFLVAAAPVQAGPITVLAEYRLGDADPGALIGNTANSTTVDSSGNGNTLTRFGSPTYVGGSPFDPAGLGVAFNGSGDYYRGAEIAAGTNNFGIEAWVKAGTTSGPHIIAYNGNTATNGFGLYQSGSTFQSLYGGVTFGNQNVAVTAGAWVHLALVRDGGITKFYVDNVLVSSAALGAPNPLAGTGFMMIGTNHLAPSPPIEYFNGSISEVRLFTFAPGQFNINDLQKPAVPAPATLALLAIGLAGFGFGRRRKA